MQRANAVQASTGSNADFWRRQTAREVHEVSVAWSRAAEPEDAHATEPSLRGIVVGRVQSWKGPDVLCRALELMGERAPAIDWVGKDMPFQVPGSSYSQFLSAKYPAIWGPLINHLPPVAADEVAKLHRAARFVVVPSTWDVLNYACIEAMAAGKNVVCSRGAGVSQVIEDGVNGLVFETNDPGSLAASLHRVQSLSEPQRRAMGEEARKTVEQAFDPERSVRQRMEHYSRVVSRFRPHPIDGSDWLRDACGGREPAEAELSFLDNLPLRPLLRYSARRLAAKLFGRKSA
jgi:glycosyltransferase involved in cell wall biosynthesis